MTRAVKKPKDYSKQKAGTKISKSMIGKIAEAEDKLQILKEFK